jgi:DNA-binding PadR family transcriptional regulator
VSPRFGHGELRLLLLSALQARPASGYDLIKRLEVELLGQYRPSAGTVYPRLTALEREGLVRATSDDGRRRFELTDAGREVVRSRGQEIEAIQGTAVTLAGFESAPAPRSAESARAAADRMRSSMQRDAAAARRRTRPAVIAPSPDAPVAIDTKVAVLQRALEALQADVLRLAAVDPSRIDDLRTELDTLRRRLES